MATEAETETPETTEMVNGILGCASCGGLLCVQVRNRRSNVVVEKIAVALQPHPYDDIARVQCASCGEVLWERGGDG